MKKLFLTSKQVHRLLLGFGLVASLGYLAFVLWHYRQTLAFLPKPQQALAWLEQQLDQNNLPNFLVLTGLTALTSALPFLSSSVLAIFNGLVFGPYLASVMNIAANLLGNSLLLVVMQKISLSDKSPKWSKHLTLLERFKNPSLGLIVGYMLPFIPTFLVTYNAQQLKISKLKWLACVLLGVSPASILYAFGGDALFKGNWLLLAILLALLAVFYGLYRLFSKEKSEAVKGS